MKGAPRDLIQIREESERDVSKKKKQAGYPMYLNVLKRRQRTGGKFENKLVIST